MPKKNTRRDPPPAHEILKPAGWPVVRRLSDIHVVGKDVYGQFGLAEHDERGNCTSLAILPPEHIPGLARFLVEEF